MEMGAQLIVSFDKLEEWGIVLGTPGFKASSLSTTPILLNISTVRETYRQGISINTKLK